MKESQLIGIIFITKGECKQQKKGRYNGNVERYEIEINKVNNE